MKKLLIVITDQQNTKLRNVANQTGLSLSELFRRAFDRTYGNSGPLTIKEPKGRYNANR